ncbi:hypothetical protein I4U23_019996 [Adineta vaga]|nr:hypothetical protein I4U23_019996 [Adineta vaga]
MILFMCLCSERYANCFPFEQRPPHYLECPKSTCICSECFFGSRCQFATTGLGLSLDAIFGYQIRPRKPFTQQRTIIKISTTIVICMMVCSLFNSISSIITFQNKTLRQIDCGIYLLVFYSH